MATYFLIGCAMAFVVTVIYFWGYLGDRFNDKELAWKLWVTLGMLSIFIWPAFLFFGLAFILSAGLNKITPGQSKKKAK